MRSATAKSGGVYLYANQLGCDGGRLNFDGCALVSVNGQIVAQGSQFSLAEVEVVTAIVDLEEVRSYRISRASRSVQAGNSPTIYSIKVPFSISKGTVTAHVSRPIEVGCCGITLLVFTTLRVC